MRKVSQHLLIISVASALLLSTPAIAQSNAAWHGQDSEFGSIRTPYAKDMDGERVVVEARVVLRENYAEQDARFFMFGFTVENTPMDLTFDHLLRADTGEEMPCHQREGEASGALKCFVDLKHMPPEGTEITMIGSVGADRAGSFQAGAIVVPFTYTWERIQMSNGLNAELYGYTVINIRTPSDSSGNGKLAGIGNNVPGFGTLGLIAGVGAATALVALRGRR